MAHRIIRVDIYPESDAALIEYADGVYVWLRRFEQTVTGEWLDSFTKCPPSRFELQALNREAAAVGVAS